MNFQKVSTVLFTSASREWLVIGSWAYDIILVEYVCLTCDDWLKIIYIEEHKTCT